jgi:hypothetical protein
MGLPQGQGSQTKYSRSWNGSLARIAIKSGHQIKGRALGAARERVAGVQALGRPRGKARRANIIDAYHVSIYYFGW